MGTKDIYAGISEMTPACQHHYVGMEYCSYSIDYFFTTSAMECRINLKGLQKNGSEGSQQPVNSRRRAAINICHAACNQWQIQKFNALSSTQFSAGWMCVGMHNAPARRQVFREKMVTGSSAAGAHGKRPMGPRSRTSATSSLITMFLYLVTHSEYFRFCAARCASDNVSPPAAKQAAYSLRFNCRKCCNEPMGGVSPPAPVLIPASCLNCVLVAGRHLLE